MIEGKISDLCPFHPHQFRLVDRKSIQDDGYHRYDRQIDEDEG